MNSEGEFTKRISFKTAKANIDSRDGQFLVIKREDLEEILKTAKSDFPEKEETRILGSDGQEHSYETYDTEAIERWFVQWFGK